MIEKPEIDITGEYKEDRYVTEVKIKILQKDKKGEKTVYKITGAENEEYREIKDTEEINLKRDGIYKVTAYTYGKDGNKSEEESIILVIEKERYTVTYDLAGGTLEEEKTNPTIYTIETESFTLNNPEKTGYTFAGWTGSNGEEPEITVTIEQGSTGNKTYTANWIANTDTKYIIETYEMDLNGEYVKVNTEEKAGETDTIVSATPEQKEGFTYNGDESTPRGTITPDGSTVLKLYYSRNKYAITLEKDTGIESTEGAESYYYGANIVVNATVKPGYTWSKWTSNSDKIQESTDKEYTITVPAENITLTANTTVNTYTITYDLTGGNLAEGTTNPEKYTVETESFTLNNPNKVGYTFAGWTGSNGETKEITVTIEQGSIENKTYTANWIANTDTKYTVETYEMNLNGEYVKINTEEKAGETDTIVSATPEQKEGFTYNGDESTQRGTIAPDGSTVLKLYYSRNKYTVTLEKGVGIESTEGAESYYYGATVTINAEVKPGYTWSKWTSDSEKIQESTDKEYTITVPAENITLTANTTVNTYTITYDLTGGTLETGKTNPTTYTVETENFTLNNPTKVGYTFAGWTGSNGEEPEITVTIEQGSIGNKTYTANWIANTDTKYIIETYEMDLNGEYVKINTEEKAGETDTIVSATPEQKEGFTYNGDESTPRGTIAPDGSTVLKLYYSRNKYAITLEKDTGIESTEGAESYYYGANIVVNATVKPGYTWSKWTSNSDKIQESTDKEYTITAPAENITLTANTTVNTYTITYDLTGGNLAEGTTNPEEYTVETESFTLNNPEKTGYTFAGWTGSNGETKQITVTIEQGSTGNKTYTANWTANTDTKYTVETYEMNLNGEYVKVNTEEKAGETDTEVSAEIITKEGFTYEESLSTPNGTIAPDGSTVLKLYYSRNKYTVTLEKGVGIESTEGAESYYYGATVTINAEVKPGYTWSKWTSNSEKIQESTDKEYTITIPAENVTLTANTTVNTYTITYDLTGGNLAEGTTNPEKYTVETESFTLNNPEKTGYTFAGWTGSNGETKQITVTIEQGSIGNKTYTANWIANTDTKYTVETYEMNLNGEYVKVNTEEKAGETDTEVSAEIITKEGFTYEETISTPSETVAPDGSTVLKLYYSRNKYTVILEKGVGIESTEGAESYYYGATVTINAEVKPGYTWSKWTSNSEKIQESTDKEYTITVPAENITLTANTTVNTYTITYDLTGGNLAEGTTNPEKYTVETESFTLNNPNKVGYTFAGWTGSNGETKEITVTIEQGSIENKTYTANWIANTDTKYTVETYEMNLNGEYVKINTEEKAGETDTIVSATPEQKEGFTYNGDESTQRGTIAPDGSTVLKLYYSRNKYTVTLEKGVGVESTEGAESYYYGATVTINAEVKEGYTWSKWTSNSEKIQESTDKEYTITVPAENITLTANTTVNTYTITYDLTGGNLAEGTTNSEEYTVETESFTLNNPEKTGYTFAGWTGSNGETKQITVTIEQGSTGNKTYTANWIANTDTEYKEITYKMNTSGRYEETIVNRQGTTGQSVSMSTVTEIGFTYDGTISSPSGIIAPDGSTVLKVYYRRNMYNLTLNAGTGIKNVVGAGSYYYGSSVQITATVKNGYTWSKWTSSNTSLIADSTSKTYNVTIPAEDVTLTAYGNNTLPTISLSVKTIDPAILTTPSDGEYIIINGKGNKISLKIDVKDNEDVNGVNDVTVQISNEAGSSFTDISDNVYGFYTVTIVATDSAGAVTEKTVKINVFNAKQKFLDDVYRSVFNRGIDIYGQDNWMSQLEEYGPDVVLLGIFASTEMDERINDIPIWDESKKILVQNYTYSNIDNYLKIANDLEERYIRLAYVTFLQRKVDVANENENPPGIAKVLELKNKIKNGKWDEDRYNAYEYYKHCIDPENNGSVALGEFIGMFLNSLEYNNILHEYVKVDTASIETFRKSATDNNRGW